MTKSAKNTRETRPARGERGTRTAKAQRDLDEVRETNTNLIIGRNPVNEALKAGREIDRILVSSEEGSMKVLIAKAKERGIPV
ncbi:MAG: hypothetical protein II113_00050, partial [Firmicutes bacterium]|nr:hypothetical protein [Bacillota bacterium]